SLTGRSASKLRNSMASKRFDLPTALGPAMHVNGPNSAEKPSRFLKPSTSIRVSMTEKILARSGVVARPRGRPLLQERERPFLALGPADRHREVSRAAVEQDLDVLGQRRDHQVFGDRDRPGCAAADVGEGGGEAGLERRGVVGDR